MRHDHAGAWLWVAIVWCAIVVGSALVHGCAEMPFPTTVNGAHTWFCKNEGCPAEADKRNGILIEWAYERKTRSCTCIIEDERHMQTVVAVPVHSERVRTLSTGHVGGPLGLD